MAHVMSYYLAIIDHNDNPIYELEFGTSRQGNNGMANFSQAMSELNPFIAHASLDILDDLQKSSPNLYLKNIDVYYNYIISAFVTGGGTRFILLHEAKNEEPIRQFFNDVYDLYVKTLMNPFYQLNTQIKSVQFSQKVVALSKKYL